MKRIFSLALLAFILIRIGVIDVPDEAIARFSHLTATPVAAETIDNARPAVHGADVDADGPVRFPLQKPRGAFLQFVFDLFELKSAS